MTQPPALPSPAKRPLRTWDLVLTIILLVLAGVLAAIMSFFGFFLAMASDPCGVRDCSFDLITTGMFVAVGLPWLFLIITAVVVDRSAGQAAARVLGALAGGVLIIASWFIGAFIAAAGVPGS